VSFAVGADAYDRFMGRYSVPLASQLADFAGVAAGQRVLDVGCGPGALTTELVGRLGPAAVAAVDPSEPFVAAARERHAGVTVRRATAEELPFADHEFDAALAQLVVHFMADPVAGLSEMARVTRERGVAGACAWEHAGGQGPLRGRVIRIGHMGGVVIGDEVEIGAHCSIAQGTIEPTQIHDHVKIDDCVFIAHNVCIGENSYIIAGAEISGSADIGRGVWISPEVAVINGVSIGDGAFVGIGAVVIRDVEPDTVVAGVPAKPMGHRRVT